MFKKNKHLQLKCGYDFIKDSLITLLRMVSKWVHMKLWTVWNSWMTSHEVKQWVHICAFICSASFLETHSLCGFTICKTLLNISLIFDVLSTYPLWGPALSNWIPTLVTFYFIPEIIVAFHWQCSRLNFLYKLLCKPGQPDHFLCVLHTQRS